MTQHVFLERSGDGWGIIVDHTPVLATSADATKYCGTKGHKVSRHWSPPGAQSKKPRVVRGLRLPQGLLSRFEVFVLAGQNILHHKPPKFLMGKQIKHLGFGSSF